MTNPKQIIREFEVNINSDRTDWLIQTNITRLEEEIEWLENEIEQTAGVGARSQLQIILTAKQGEKQEWEALKTKE